MKKTRYALISAIMLLSLGGCKMENINVQKSETIAIQQNTPATEYEKVKIYLPSNDEQNVNVTEKEVQIEKNDEPMVELVQALVTEKALPEGTEVEHWSVSKDDAPAITIDFNKAFSDGINKTGTTGETIMLESLLNTVWSYFSPASVVITVDGEVLETGHNIYDRPFTSPSLGANEKPDAEK